MDADLQNLLCGGIAGCTSRTAVAPLERLKILLQVQDLVGPSSSSNTAPKYQGVLQSLRRIHAEEGARGFFKGNGANCVRVFPYVAIQFAVFERAKPLLLDLQRAYSSSSAANDQLDSKLKVVGGACAGIASVVVTYPLDAARARLTVQGGLSATHYTGVYDAIRSVLRAEGLRGVYRGVLPTIWGIAPYVGLNFAVFEALRARVPTDKKGNPDAVMLLACGGAAGACGQTAAYPMDVLRRRFQLSALRPGGSSGQSEAYSSTLGGLRAIVRGEGVRGLYKGFVPNLLKVVPSIAIMFTTNELLKRGFKRLEAARPEEEHRPLRRRSTH